MDILGDINSTKKLHKLSPKQKKELAKDIRQKIIEVVSKNGGHLASNLGIVELMIALHTVYESPTDKFIFDVGHQCYPHKLLTGRLSEFDTLRQAGGISGYPDPKESPHDHYHTGHASTALSLAAGEMIARDMKGEKNHIVAIVGDGSLTGGESFEALNHIGSLESNVLVVLNDNQMSISPSVGALSLLTNKLRASLTYRSMSRQLSGGFSKMGKFGEWVVGLGMRLKTALKNILMANQYFEQLGFRYFGPIDGHNTELTIAFLKRIKLMKGPVILHVLTKKGKGYTHAENGPTKFHGTPPFIAENGFTKPGEMSFSKVFGKSLSDLIATNKKVVAISAAMTEGTGLGIVGKEHPTNLVDVGIAEEHAVSVATGLANASMKPVVAIYSTFLQRSYDQIIHDVALSNLPVVFAIDRAGLVPDDGPTHQGIFDLSYMSTVPNMTIMAPADAYELDQMLKLALSLNSPCAIRYPKDKVPESTDKPVLLGKACVEKTGSDVLIIFIGVFRDAVFEAVSALESMNISCSIINLRFAKPIDFETIASEADGKKLVVTIEDGIVEGGIGQRIKTKLMVETICLGVSDEFPPAAKRDVLLKRYGLDAEGIQKSVLHHLEK